MMRAHKDSSFMAPCKTKRRGWTLFLIFQLSGRLFFPFQMEVEIESHWYENKSVEIFMNPLNCS